ncbi:DUF6074 family protein [Mesorhizobium sp. CO1-1-4]|uniref:DUF6074 family protein n=1 Tax=unclassified Mesorhizobium TaxID=325217 RepID=UPI00398C64A2
MDRRVGRIRSTAEKMLAEPTERAAESYRDQVTDGMLRQMARAGISGREQDEHLGAFCRRSRPR